MRDYFYSYKACASSGEILITGDGIISSAKPTREALSDLKSGIRIFVKTQVDEQFMVTIVAFNNI